MDQRVPKVLSREQYRAFALNGAEARMNEILAEGERIYVAFPDLRPAPPIAQEPPAAVEIAAKPRRRRRRNSANAQVPIAIEPAKRKRRISAAGKRAIRAGAKKRWAAYRAAQQN